MTLTEKQRLHRHEARTARRRARQGKRRTRKRSPRVLPVPVQVRRDREKDNRRLLDKELQKPKLTTRIKRVVKRFGRRGNR